MWSAWAPRRSIFRGIAGFEQERRGQGEGAVGREGKEKVHCGRERHIVSSQLVS